MLLDGHDLDTVMTRMRRQFFGKYAGTVEDTNDPEGLGRLKVQVPGVFPAGTSVWAWPCVPYAGKQIGFKCLPPAKTNVWVEFANGDSSHPIWVGFFWGKGEMPAEAGQGDNVKLWKTGAFTIRIDDKAGEMVITANNGGTLTISGEIKAQVSTASVTVAPDGVTVDAGKTIEVTQASVSVNDGALAVT